MSIQIIKVANNVYKQLGVSKEPLWQRCISNGQIVFLHQSGYGGFPDSKFEIVEANHD